MNAWKFYTFNEDLLDFEIHNKLPLDVFVPRYLEDTTDKLDFLGASYKHIANNIDHVMQEAFK